jgi:ABC-type cobalamin/Fe3+-siderophores transport system ATPase subunit
MLKWSEDKLPLWRQDALRRIATKDKLEEQDYDDIYELAKQENGLIADDFKVAFPFEKKHFPAEPQAEHCVNLSSIYQVKNVGLIPEDQNLPFLEKGITIIYGNNGAGKSGYAKILKQACRARIPGAIYPNAFSPDYAKLIPSARIGYVIDDQANSADWVARQASHDILRSISVFDSECATHYLKSSEAARLQPTALTNLQNLATGLARQISARCDKELHELHIETQVFDEIDPNTEAGASFRPLNSNTDLTRSRTLAVLSVQDLAELELLPKQIAEGNLAVRAEHLEGSAATLDQIVTGFQELYERISDAAIEVIAKDQRNLREAEAAEKVAATLLAAEEKIKLLPGTGEGAWSVLFDAARDFSTDSAYVGSEFPVSAPDARCVLCQQTLDQESKNRLIRFNEFVNDRASENAKNLRAKWKTSIAVLKQILRPIVISKPILLALNRRRPGLEEEIARFVEDVASRHAWLLLAAEETRWDGLPLIRDRDPSLSISEIAKTLRDEAKAYRDAMNIEALQIKRDRLSELQARVTLMRHLPAMEIVVRDLNRKLKLDACRADAMNTRATSAFATKLSKTYVGDKLASEMNLELRRLTVHHVTVEVTGAGEGGAVRLGLRLPDAKIDAYQILSEAEQRMAALAYFFAEQTQYKSNSGIVFDDPVSSLDHSYRSAVAERIVSEARARQVVVFTHDAVFFAELCVFANDHAVPFEVRTIEHRLGVPGYVDAGLPWDLRNWKERIKEHRIRQKTITATYCNPPGEIERAEMRTAYADLRATLEIGIEETILNGTVVRFRDGISVGRLKGVMTVEEEDFIEVERLHDRCCRHVNAHAQAGGQQRPIPQPDQLLKDIDDLAVLLKKVGARRG